MLNPSKLPRASLKTLSEKVVKKNGSSKKINFHWKKHRFSRVSAKGDFVFQKAPKKVSYYPTFCENPSFFLKEPLFEDRVSMITPHRRLSDASFPVWRSGRNPDITFRRESSPFLILRGMAGFLSLRLFHLKVLSANQRFCKRKKQLYSDFFVFFPGERTASSGQYFLFSVYCFF